MTTETREARIRAAFPAAAETIYLNTAAEGLGTATLERSLARYAAAKQRGSLGRDEFAETSVETKTRLARWLGCRTESIAFAGSTSDAIATVLRGLPWQAGDNVVITDLEFPGAMIGCLALVQQTRIEVRVVAHCDGEIALAALAERIDARTRLVILSQVSFHSGARFDIAGLTQIAHERGALVLIDASQSLGAVPVDVGEVDFLVACPFKWLAASHGLGLLYVRPGAEAALSRHLFGWRGVTDFLGVMCEGAFTPHAGARRFETGMPSYPAIYALHDALALLDELDPVWIAERVAAHAGAIDAICRELGLRVLTPADPARRAGIVSFAHPRAAAVGEALAARGVTVWRGDGRVRFSAHFYTRDDDLLALRRLLPDALARAGDG